MDTLGPQGRQSSRYTYIPYLAIGQCGISLSPGRRRVPLVFAERPLEDLIRATVIICAKELCARSRPICIEYSALKRNRR